MKISKGTTITVAKGLGIIVAALLWGCSDGSDANNGTGGTGAGASTGMGGHSTTGTGGAAGDAGGTAGTGGGGYTPIIASITVGQDTLALPYYGDLWPNTWAADDKLYMSWGDGTGMPGCVPSNEGLVPGAWDDWTAVQQVGSCFEIHPTDGDSMQDGFCSVADNDCSNDCFELCPFVDTGLLALSGDLPNVDACIGDSCVIARYLPEPLTPGGTLIPKGPNGIDDKPSSMIYVDNVLYWAGHTPGGATEAGYIAFSGDYGQTWGVDYNSPWGATSNFRELMFINMGKAYGAAKDNYVYALGTGTEWVDQGSTQSLYLARVDRQTIADYSHWRYYTGLDPQTPEGWSQSESDAEALAGLHTYSQGSVMYHEGIGRFLFLAGVDADPPTGGGLFEAENPWGPWTRVGTIPAISISSLIPKGAGTDFVYYASAGGSSTYNLNIRAIEFTLQGTP